VNCLNCARNGVVSDMKPGKAMIPCWGNYGNRFGRGSTLYPVGGTYGSVIKCGECGHSVSFHGMLYMAQGEGNYIFQRR
jgi:hypothetical protein